MSWRQTQAAPTSKVASFNPISVPGIVEAMMMFERSKECEDFFRVIYRSGELQKDVCRRKSAKACEKATNVSLFFTKLVEYSFILHVPNNLLLCFSSFLSSHLVWRVSK